MQEAYPSVDIIINAIPPLGKQHSNQSLTQTQVDEYNKAIVQMCQDNGIAFDFTCGGEQVKQGRWDFTYTISAGGSISMEVMSLELMDDGTLSVVFVITPNPNGGSDPLKLSTTYRKI